MNTPKQKIIVLDPPYYSFPKAVHPAETWGLGHLIEAKLPQHFQWHGIFHPEGLTFRSACSNCGAVKQMVEKERTPRSTAKRHNRKPDEALKAILDFTEHRDCTQPDKFLGPPEAMSSAVDMLLRCAAASLAAGDPLTPHVIVQFTGGVTISATFKRSAADPYSSLAALCLYIRTLSQKSGRRVKFIASAEEVWVRTAEPNSPALDRMEYVCVVARDEACQWAGMIEIKRLGDVVGEGPARLGDAAWRPNASMCPEMSHIFV